MERLLDILATCISNPHYLSKASDVLSEFENAKGYAPALLLILHSNPQKPIQTLAGIILKNLISDRWENLCFEDRASTKQEIFACLRLPDPKLRSLAVIPT